MRFLFCSLDSPGYLYPSIRLALDLEQHSHDTLFVASPNVALCEAGMKLAPWHETVCFDPSAWFDPNSVSQQLAYISAAINLFKPHALVAHQLTVSAFFAAHKHQLPLIVIGFAAPILPTSTEHVLDQTYRANKRLKRRFEQVQTAFAKVSNTLGLPLLNGEVDKQPYLGDIHLLRTVPELEKTAFLMPTQVHMIGSLQWEPEHDNPRLTSFLKQAEYERANVLYVQLGRSFGEGSMLGSLMNSVQTGMKLVIDTLRADDIPEEMASSDHVYIDDHIPLGFVLPYTKAVITSGHTSLVIGALTHCRPMLLLPDGSGTEDISERCEKAGAAIVLDSSTSAAELQRALCEIVTNSSFQQAAQDLSYAFRNLDSTNFVPIIVERIIGFYK